MESSLHLKIVLIFTIGFGFASLLGYISQRAKFSPILGYLIAGYLIGPFSPGFVADVRLAEQLAAIGVILMMFGAGLHFRWQDLLKTAKIAIPGAILQTLVATIAGTFLIYSNGWSLEAGIIFGMGIGVASTVVLIRVLTDNGILNTVQGHIAVGWLIVEDLITVAVLLLIPSLAASNQGMEMSFHTIGLSFGLTLVKSLIFVAIMFTIGRKIISFFLSKIIVTKSHELFTLSVLAVTFIIATGSTYLLGTSIVLGAFIAGMLIGESETHRHVASSVTPLRDVFVVIFFLSVGMLFDLKSVWEHLYVFLGTIAIILILKPLTAFLITVILRYKLKVALTVALGLAQIGEFTFILAEQANAVDLLPDESYDIIVACAIITIALNPFLFKLLKKNDVI